MYASVNGAEMYYEIAGEGHPFVFIHGLGYDCSTWGLQKEFARRYLMVTCDLRGHGRSTKRHERYSVDLFAEDVSALFTHLSLKKAHVLGVSMGGCVAARLALLYPDAVSSLILVNAFAKVEVHTFRGAYKYLMRKYLLPLLPTDSLARMSADRLFSRDTELHALAYRKFLENERYCYLEASRAAFSFDCLDSLHKISAPTLIIAGDNDRVVSLNHAVRLAGGIANSRLVVLKGGHALPVESARTFNDTIWRFLENRR